MSFDYSKTAATARRLLGRFGSAAQVLEVSGAYDPATGQNATTTTPHDVFACVFDFDREFIDGTLVLHGDKQCFCSSSGYTPKPGDVFMWQGEPLSVVASKPLAPSGAEVIVELQVRR